LSFHNQGIVFAYADHGVKVRQRNLCSFAG
jgi:hypothetical protein